MPTVQEKVTQVEDDVDQSVDTIRQNVLMMRGWFNANKPSFDLNRDSVESITAWAQFFYDARYMMEDVVNHAAVLYEIQDVRCYQIFAEAKVTQDLDIIEIQERLEDVICEARDAYNDDGVAAVGSLGEFFDYMRHQLANNKTLSFRVLYESMIQDRSDVGHWLNRQVAAVAPTPVAAVQASASDAPVTSESLAADAPAQAPVSTLSDSDSDDDMDDLAEDVDLFGKPFNG